ncbi:uncharacterized protein SOCE26_002690 [Sorangium cellulosum]|uniref:AAA-ATPase-like domain-containing protein n=1 Tax=Sorangium cellulosum TaxID=56 RepID=A0A2L0EHW1_SORCE|nr:AAA family ATPase [Sorangium cellulosum]AUX38888.1 uncharacterized protein SOCE26_002690 [Sorangium cellulosum]
MPAQLSLGVDDFRKLRELGLEYIDKSHLACELIDRPGLEVALLPRPRRFGKTLNLSMLRCFFERRERREDDLAHLFRGLHVWEAGEPYRAHFQRYPVIYLTLKGTRHESFEGCWEAIRRKIVVVFDEHRSLLEGGALSPREALDFQGILDGSASRALYERSLLDLSSYLHRTHGERVVLLIDDYDEPIHAGHACGYAPQILGVCRNLLGEALKGNPHLFKGVLTGVLRVARESIFSGLNNVSVYSLLRPEFNTCFGFTEPEVEGLLERAGLRARLGDVRAWYNGYVFGGQVVYNPWSILSFLAGGDAEGFERQLQIFVADLLSYHDVTRVEPEQVVHAFVVGLLAVLEPEHQVRSNRESGSGRPDVLIRPARPGHPGVVVEIKVVGPDRTPEAALEQGLGQIRERDYAAELRAAGAAPVHAFAVAFDGKRVWVRAAPSPGAPAAG